MKTNILYLLNHKTLTDFEVPILIKNGYGVLLNKSFDSLVLSEHSLYENNYYYDSFLNIHPEKIKQLNTINWYSNRKVSQDIINILNENFKIIFITLLTKGDLLDQLVSTFNGTIYYRFFGRESTHRYDNAVIYHSNVRYIFSYKEILDFEQKFDGCFTDSNSLIIPLGLPDDFFIKYQNIYKPTNNKICFVCSKININSYYTQIYKDFISHFSNTNYIILGKNNVNTNNGNIVNNLADKDFYKIMSECTVLYYHGIEPRHLHYHPLEAIVIGIPVIFHEQSLLSSYLAGSPGSCKNVVEAKEKIEKILNNDKQLINDILKVQSKAINRLRTSNNLKIFDKL